MRAPRRLDGLASMLLASLLAALALLGCDSSGGTDAGGFAVDAGGGADAGGADAAVELDAGPYDAGPYDAGPIGEPLDRLRAATRSLDATFCACDHDGFADAADCAAFFDNPSLDACDDAALVEVPSASAPIACLASAREAFATCAASAGCDREMLEACSVVESDATAACPDVPRGFFEASERCVDGMVGTPSPCPENTTEVTTTGQAVFTGSTVEAGNDAPAQSCASACEPDTADRAYAWTAPADGTYVFDTAGSVFDTVLSLTDGCAGAELACDDDARRDPDIGLRSRVTYAMTAGQVVTIWVKGCTAYDAGDFQVNIYAGP